MSETVYILTNECMPGLVKIGRTQTSVEDAMRALYSNSVPYPFECFYAALVEQGELVERKLHYAFGDHRVPTHRDFFRLDPNKVRAVLELVAIEELTPFIESEITYEMKEFCDKKPSFRFSLADIPLEAELYFGRDETVTCRVINDKTVEFNGMPTSINTATEELLKERGWKSTQVQGSLYWIYEGESLEERRHRIERQV